MILFLLGIANASVLVQLPMGQDYCRAKNYLAGAIYGDDCFCSQFQNTGKTQPDYNACVPQGDGTSQQNCVNTPSLPRNKPQPACFSNDILNFYNNLLALRTGNTTPGVGTTEKGVSGAFNPGPPLNSNESSRPVLENNMLSTHSNSEAIPPSLNPLFVQTPKGAIPIPVVVKTRTVYTTVVHRVDKPVFNYLKVPPVTVTARGPTTTYTMPPLTLTHTKPPVMIPLAPTTIYTSVQPTTYLRTIFAPLSVSAQTSTVTVVQKPQPLTVTSVEIRSQLPSTVFVPPVSVTTTTTKTLPPVVIKLVQTSTSTSYVTVTITTTVTIPSPAIPIYLGPDHYHGILPVNTHINMSTDEQSVPGIVNNNNLGGITRNVPNNISFSNSLNPGAGVTDNGIQPGNNGRIYLPMPLSSSSGGNGCNNVPGVVCLSDLLANANKTGNSVFGCGLSNDDSGCSYLPLNILPSEYNEACNGGQYDVSCENTPSVYNNIGLCNGSETSTTKGYCILDGSQDASSNNDDNVEVVYLSDLIRRPGNI